MVAERPIGVPQVCRMPYPFHMVASSTGRAALRAGSPRFRRGLKVLLSAALMSNASAAPFGASSQMGTLQPLREDAERKASDGNPADPSAIPVVVCDNRNNGFRPPPPSSDTLTLPLHTPMGTDSVAAVAAGLASTSNRSTHVL